MAMLNETLSESFYVTFVSNNNIDYYPENKPTSFTNRLLKYFEPSRYVVGLYQIFYSDKFSPAPVPAILSDIPSVPPDITYFGERDDDKLIVVKIKRYITLSTRKDEMSFPIYIASYINRIETAFPFIKIFFDYEGEMEGKTTLKFEDTTNEFLEFEMDPKLALILGYDQNKFGPGTHIAPSNMRKLEFESLNKYDELLSMAFKIASYNISVDEPLIDHNLEGVLESCEEALETINIKVKFQLKDKNRIFYSKIETVDVVSIKLPPKVNEALGLEHIDFITPFTPPFLVPQNPPPKQNPSNVAFITCNAVIDTQIGENSLSLLRVIERKESTTSTQHHLVFAPVLYQRLRFPLLPYIQIKLLNSEFGLLPNTQISTICVLHFKRIY